MPASAAVSSPLVLIHGDDDLQVKQRARQLHQPWSVALGGMDHELIDAQVGNSGEALKVLNRLREALNTLPFFGGGKAIWLQNCNLLGDERVASAAAVTESLADLTQELKAFVWQNVRLLISAGKVDKRKAFYKAIEKLGSVELYAAWSVDDKNWVGEAETLALKALKARRKEITGETLAELIEAVGPNSRELAKEGEKLFLYVGDRRQIGP